jgi:hypothetical protein
MLWVRISISTSCTKFVIKFVSDLRQVGGFLRSGVYKAISRRFVSYDLFPFVIVYVMTLHPWKRRWIPQGEMCFCRSNALIPCSFCDSKINIYIYRLSSLWIYYHFEYVDCNIWFIALFRLAIKLHSFNGHIWKSLSPKSLFIDKCENDIHAHVYYQFDTYVAEFHIVSWRQMMPRGKP